MHVCVNIVEGGRGRFNVTLGPKLEYIQAGHKVI